VEAMGKTWRRQPQYEDDRWKRKGGPHKGPSRKAQKQRIEKDIDNETGY